MIPNFYDHFGGWPMVFVTGALALALGFVMWAWIAPASSTTHQTCTFDRNELGPMGAHGQWWWEIYKCSDGTERRVLVAGPRG